MKWLSRQVENNLRSAEILYTMAWNKAEQRSHKNFVVLFEHIYAGLVKARRNLALFQHHDAITGNFGSVVVIVFIYILFL
jgi:alpha-mannosidase